MRSLVIVILAVLATGAAFAQDITLMLWSTSGFTPASGKPAVAAAYEAAYRQFEQEHPGIKIEYEVIAGGADALSKFLTAASRDNLPDLAVLDGFWIARILQTGKLQALDDYWTDEAQAGWLKEAVDTVTFDGTVYAVPFYTGWRGLFYNINTLHDLGYDAPPTDWDEFLDFAESAKTAGMWAIMLPGIGQSETTALHMLSMFWGLGGQLVDDTGKPIFFEGANRDALETTFSLYRELVEKGYMPSDIATLSESGLHPYFYTGESATIAESSSRVTTFQQDSPSLIDNLGAADYPLPNGAKPVPMFGGYTYGIFTEDAARRDAAWEFIEFMTRPDVLGELNALAGYIPIVNEIWEQPFYRDDPLMQQFRAIVESGRMKARPPVPIYPIITNVWSSQVADVISGKLTPAEAVDIARDLVMPEYERLINR